MIQICISKEIKWLQKNKTNVVFSFKKDLRTTHWIWQKSDVNVVNVTAKW